ncbi:MAG: TlpA disulfide reductase family protein [Bacteroidales bacterium]|nr:TlpA disulfide reductase family protein [Bacteroidales bacterium]
MNKLLFSVLALCLSFGAMSQKDCHISGKMDENKAGQYVYLTYGKQVLDSAMVQEDASFEIRTKAENKLCSLLMKGARRGIDMLTEAGEIKVDYRQGITKCGKENSLLVSYRTSITALGDKLNDKAAEIQQEAISDEAKQEKINKEYENYLVECKKTLDELIDTHSKSQIAAWALASQSSDLKPEEFFACYDKLSSFAKEYPALVAAHGLFVALDNTSEGKMFVDFTINKGSLDGKDVKFSDYVGKGKYTLVDFWATWCGPCKREIPNLREIYKDFGSDITVLSVAVWDKKEATEKFIKQNDMPWNHIIDAQKIPTDIYGIQGIPQIILFAPDGTVVKRDLRGEEIRKTLKEVLKK